MRYFRCNTADAAYDEARLTLDNAWGLPDDRGTVTCIAPAADAPHDQQGRIVLAVNDEFCEYPAAASLLGVMLASGAVSEITQAEYLAAISTLP